jgi:hypothetical protein
MCEGRKSRDTVPLISMLRSATHQAYIMYMLYAPILECRQRELLYIRDFPKTTSWRCKDTASDDNCSSNDTKTGGTLPRTWAAVRIKGLPSILFYSILFILFLCNFLRFNQLNLYGIFFHF